MNATTSSTGCGAFICIAEIDAAHVKRVLDLGAEGIVFPLVRDADDVRLAVSTMRYPPKGIRGFGPFLAQSRWNTNLMDYRTKMEDRLICCLLVETKEAVANIEEICAVEGVDFIVAAPFDLSTDLGIPGQFDHPDYTSALEKIERACEEANIPIGGVALSKEQADGLFARGYRIIAGFDAIWLRNMAAETQSWADQ